MCRPSLAVNRLLRSAEQQLLGLHLRVGGSRSGGVYCAWASGGGAAMLDCVTMRSIPVRLWVLAFLSGLLQVLPFPIAGPVPVWRTAFCWVALAPLLWALTGNDAGGRPLRVAQGAALGYASGFVWYLGNCYWVYATMHQYGGIAKPAAAGILVLFCLYLGLYHAFFGALIAAFRRANLGRINLGVQGALLLSPFAWVAVELARARITGFPWDLLGITQVDNPLLTRLAPYVGAYGISFVIASVNALWLRADYSEAAALHAACAGGGLCGHCSAVCCLSKTNCSANPRGNAGDGDSGAGEPGSRCGGGQGRASTYNGREAANVFRAKPLSSGR